MTTAIAKAAPRRSSDAGETLDAAFDLIEARVLTAISWLRGRATAAELAPLITGAPETVTAAIAADAKLAAEAIATDVNVAYLDAGANAAAVIGAAVDTPGTFAATSSPAVARMQAADLALVQGFTAEQVAVVRDALVVGLQRGDNPIAIARAIEDVVGLTAQQSAWVTSYRRALETNDFSALERKLRDKRSDRSVRRAAMAGTPLPQAQIDSMVARYRDAAIRLRAQTIARTEALRAVHQGQQDAIEAAIARGDLSLDQVAFTWIATKDRRTRPSHWAMHGQVRPWGEPFVSGDDHLLWYPCDPAAPASETVNCRCTRVFSF